MGSRTSSSTSNSFNRRKENNERFFSSVHQAIVTDVNIEAGTINITLSNSDYKAVMDIPVVGMSTPQKAVNQNNIDYSKSSWGRYVPQVGSILYVGFGANGVLYPLGYGYLSYSVLGMADKDMMTQEKGGIGWSKLSRAELKPGDWDFKSSRNSSFYLGDRARLSSGASSFTAHATEIKATIASPLIELSAGASSLRVGGARRQNIPTDGSESYVVGPTGLIPPQEFNLNMRPLIPTIPPAPLPTISRLSLGEVIDETTKLPMISPLVPASLVRYYMSVFDVSYFLPAYEIIVDMLGNKKEEALTATFFTWNTPLANWDITNTTTKITSIGSFSVESPVIQLGGNSAVFSLVKGEPLQAAITSFCTAFVAANGVISLGLTGAPTTDLAIFKAFFTAMTTASNTFLAATTVPNILSVISKTA